MSTVAESDRITAAEPPEESPQEKLERAVEEFRQKIRTSRKLARDAEEFCNTIDKLVSEIDPDETLEKTNEELKETNEELKDKVGELESTVEEHQRLINFVLQYPDAELREKTERLLELLDRKTGNGDFLDPDLILRHL